MLEMLLLSFIALLFILSFIAVQALLTTLLSYKKRKSRLLYRYKQNWLDKLSVYLHHGLVISKHVALVLETVHSKLTVKLFMQMSVVLFLTGACVGALLFTSIKGIFTLGLILGLMPYLFFRMRLVSNQMKTRIEFLPAVEVFYQAYVMADHRNLRVILQNILQEGKLLYPIKPVFETLNYQLSMNRDISQALQLFHMSLGHKWSQYFVQVFRIGWAEGVDISYSLKELITDMRKAQLSDQAARNRLLEIRVANFTPILFLVIFLIVNFQLNYQNAYYYYLIDPVGRSMLLDAIMIIFASFIMGLYLSIRRM